MVFRKQCDTFLWRASTFWCLRFFFSPLLSGWVWEAATKCMDFMNKKMAGKKPLRSHLVGENEINRFSPKP